MSESPPTRLYKYLPSRYLDAFVHRGEILFRNMAYFRKIEDKGRADLLEGLHVDRPDGGLKLTRQDGTALHHDGAAFINSVNTDRVFIFCLATILDDGLYKEFKADTCVQLLDTKEFVNRCERKVKKQRRFSENGFMHAPVEYYAPNEPTVRPVQDPIWIPFFKHLDYSHQHEYRLRVALAKGLKPTKRIVNRAFSLEEDAVSGIESSRKLIIGSIGDIVKVHTLAVSRRFP